MAIATLNLVLYFVVPWTTINSPNKNWNKCVAIVIENLYADVTRLDGLIGWFQTNRTSCRCFFSPVSDDLFDQKGRLSKYFKRRFSVFRVAVYSQDNKNRRFPRGAKAVITSYIDLIFPSSPCLHNSTMAASADIFLVSLNEMNGWKIGDGTAIGFQPIAARLTSYLLQNIFNCHGSCL